MKGIQKFLQLELPWKGGTKVCTTGASLGKGNKNVYNWSIPGKGEQKCVQLEVPWERGTKVCTTGASLGKGNKSL